MPVLGSQVWFGHIYPRCQAIGLMWGYSTREEVMKMSEEKKSHNELHEDARIKLLTEIAGGYREPAEVAYLALAYRYLSGGPQPGVPVLHAN